MGCDISPPEVFDPRLIQQDERTNVGQAKPESLRPLPTTREDAFTDIGPEGESSVNGQAVRPTTGPDLDTEPIVRMGLHEIIHRAVANNHDVKVAAYQPAIEGARPEPLQPGVIYRLFVTAGKIRGQHDFQLGAPPVNPPKPNSSDD